jgi:Holliday junction resolvase RusA-like endonuclease
MIEIKIKPLSVNEAWQGKRFKTPKYKNYERDVLLMLPKITIPLKPFKVSLEYGFSNKCSDIDNGIKPLLDILVKKYGFDDRDIYEIDIKKMIVKKGFEYFKFDIKTAL